MQMVTVVARETFPYAGVTRYVGDAFEATVEDARVLTLIGRVEAREKFTVSVTPVVEPPNTDDEPRTEPLPRRRRLRTEQSLDTLVE